MNDSDVQYLGPVFIFHLSPILLTFFVIISNIIFIFAQTLEKLGIYQQKDYKLQLNFNMAF